MIKTKTGTLIERRKKVVANGIGMFAGELTVDYAAGPYLFSNGEAYIDFATGIGVVSAGHCPEPVVRAIQEQAGKLLHASINVATYEPYVALCEELVELFPHGKESKVMLTNTGAESVENAIKIARQATGRTAVIAFEAAFHGRSLMAMTLTSKTNYKFKCGPFAPEVYRASMEDFYTSTQELDEEAFAEKYIQALEHMFLTHVSAANVAAIIIEAVQGEGGFMPIPVLFLQKLRKLCTAHGILLIMDEVQSGFCRTGKWAAYQHADIVPDISTWAKAMGGGLPIGAVIGRAEIMDAVNPGTIGGTYCGNPVACVSALETIRYMKTHQLDKQAAEIGARINWFLTEMMENYDCIDNVRGRGAMIGVCFREDKGLTGAEWVSAIQKACLNRHLVLLAAGLHRNVLRFLPPLMLDNITLEEALLRFGQAIEEVERSQS